MPEFSSYLPHPSQWKQYTGDYKIKVSSRVARYVLANYLKFGDDCELAIEPLLSDLRACI